MNDVLLNVVCCIGLVVLVLILIGACILVACGIISIVKSMKE